MSVTVGQRMCDETAQGANASAGDKSSNCNITLNPNSVAQERPTHTARYTH
jgi:hypothetical protein